MESLSDFRGIIEKNWKAFERSRAFTNERIGRTR